MGSPVVRHRREAATELYCVAAGVQQAVNEYRSRRWGRAFCLNGWPG
jgi:hypothetical protein